MAKSEQFYQENTLNCILLGVKGKAREVAFNVSVAEKSIDLKGFLGLKPE